MFVGGCAKHKLHIADLGRASIGTTSSEMASIGTTSSEMASIGTTSSEIGQTTHILICRINIQETLCFGKSCFNSDL